MQKLAAVLASAIPTNSPVNGPAAGANLVVITGTDLTGATAVSFGGTAATSFVVNNATPITAIAPAHTAGTVDVAVTTPDGTSANTAADNYTYAGVPTISGLTPPKDSTVGSNAVVITGTNLTAATAVSFGGTAATSFIVNSATQITAIARAHAAGAVDVNVTTPGGTTANSAADDYTYKTTPASDKPKLESHREKTPVCHKPGTPAEKTKWLPESAIAAHVGHGDTTTGECA